MTRSSLQARQDDSVVRVPRAAEGMSGLAKGLAIIEAFSQERPRLTVADAARAAGITRAAARRCLLTLVGLGYLGSDGKYFSPLPRLSRLGSRYFEVLPLPQLAQPVLAAARDLLKESISLAVLDGDESLFIARAEAPRIVSTGVRVGARLPAYCSATGRVLLSGLSDLRINDYLARITAVSRTPKTLVDKAEIRRAIMAVRRDGMGISNEELELGMRSIAVPVRDANGGVAAALSLSAASARITMRDMKVEYLTTLSQFAAKLAHLI